MSVSEVELQRFLERIRRERVEQGKPDRIKDPDALRLVAGLLARQGKP